MFRIIIRGRNCENYIVRCLNSVLMQDEKFMCTIILDPCTDRTVEIIKSMVDDRFTIVHNKEKMGLGHNIWYGMQVCGAQPEDICVFLDADDYLGLNALRVVNKVYSKKKCLATYGSFVALSTGKLHHWNNKLPKGVNHREYRFSTSHLKTVKGKVLSRIPEEYFIHKDKFVPCASDVALMMPVIDLIGTKNLYHVKKKIYYYNDKNPDSKTREKQKKWKRIVQAKKPLKRMF